MVEGLHPARQAELLPIVGATDRETTSILKGGMPTALPPSEDKNKDTMTYKQAATIVDSTQPTRKSPSSGKPTSRSAPQVRFIHDLFGIHPRALSLSYRLSRDTFA